MRRYEFSYKFRWHIENPYDEKGKEQTAVYEGGKFASEKDARKALRKDIISDMESLREIHHVRDGIVIVGCDEHENCVVTARQIEVKELPAMHYGVYWEDECCSECAGQYETLEEAKIELDGRQYDSEIDIACMENFNIEIEYDSDGLGFLSTVWKGDDRDNAEEYCERTYRIHEIDEDGNWIDEAV